ncbi:MAG: SPOR domain-containing protein [Alcanivorax sp.]|uniref:SPOR domain-containing protein n=1 Tax=unclassified Ketobacter TaxID=2639109 RepID=UPI000F22AB9F|nr:MULTISPECIES: SPOR domain-containing protein [unclassified Ketobacter]MCK5789365.1 SPOR domain-containing protein [Ketobacter sp.]RLT88107.1 MAG: SPOR domain-containing protein [Ketobacter sp. GenoA1]RLT93151.1 MAG: SPOR domain-containing protein [Ketobacter sp.]TNC83912.1 MAG: SPOR domain-containing protein [Alcanivorax sp.]
MAKSDSNLPAWVWLFTGVVTGLFLAFLYYLAGIKPTDRQMQEIEVTTPALPGTGGSGPKFDFYTLLPDREVVAPATDQPKPGKSTPAPAAPSANEPFIIQTGSFRSAQEADHRRAELILMGLDVKIQKVELGPGEAWHRVQVGPFQSQQTLEQAKSTLAENQIEHIVLRLKK